MRRAAFALMTVLGLGFAPASATQTDPIHWSASVTSKGPVMPGKPFEVGFAAKIDAGWHLYALEEPVGGPCRWSSRLARPDRSR